MESNKHVPCFITIDVEPDNVWANTYSKSYNNIKHLPYFNNLCEEFGMATTYLVTYSVLKDKESLKILENLLKQGNCEIGMHPHLW